MPELLGDFFPESELPTEASTVVVRQPHDGVSIADLLGSVTLEWYEAIAISQALCDKLSQSEDRVRPALITADSVLIAETGDVSVAAATVHSGGATAVQQVTDLLRAMMPERGVPTPLRLAVLQSSSAGSLAEWSNTIGYYERPNRKALIQAVYQRAGRAPARPPVVAASVPRRSEIRYEAPQAAQSQLFQPQSLEPLLPQPLPPQSQWLQPAPPPPLAVVRYARDWRLPRPTAKHVLAVSGGIVFAALVGTAAWMMQHQSGLAAEIAVDVAKLAVQADSAGEKVVSQAEVAAPRASAPGRQWIHLEPLKVQPQPRVGDGVKAPRQLPMPSVEPAGRAMPSSTAEPATALRGPGVEPAGRAMPSSTAEPAAPATIARVFPASSIIYSKADQDVVPPTAIYPRFPSAKPSGVSENEVAEFDVVVSETGSVESVRALRVPATMAEAMRVTMGLSAAKSWRFTPGMKDGQPVRYRQVLWVLKN